MLQNLLELIIRSTTVLLFLILEGICFYLVIQYDQKAGSLFFSSANRVSGSLYRRYDKVTDYWRLNDQIEDLADENANLRKLLDHSIYNISPSSTPKINDSLLQKFVYTPANVVSKTVVGTKNYLTIDKGKEQYIESNSGVISTDGVVGFVRNVGQYHSTIMSILHVNSRVSAAIKHRSAHGSLRWYGGQTKYMNLEGIPIHEDVEIGDTIITSGYSNKFPPGIIIGKIIEKTIPEGEIDLSLKVELAYDYFENERVTIVTNLMSNELKEIQKGLE